MGGVYIIHPQFIERTNQMVKLYVEPKIEKISNVDDVIKHLSYRINYQKHLVDVRLSTTQIVKLELTDDELETDEKIDSVVKGFLKENKQYLVKGLKNFLESSKKRKNSKKKSKVVRKK